MITSAILEKTVESLDYRGSEERGDEMKDFHQVIMQGAVGSVVVQTFLNEIVKTIVLNSVGTPETTMAEARQMAINSTAAVQSLIYFGYRLHSLELMEGLDASS